MSNVSKIIGIIFFLFFSINVSAENIDECKSDLYYANGIMMKYSEKDALKMWKDEADDLLSSKPKIFAKIANIKISYNVSQGFLDDLLESFEQVMGNEWDWKTYTLFFSKYLTDAGIQEDWVTHLKDLDKQVKGYKESIKLGHNVIVIAHSQGNYYTNEAYDLLDEWMKSYFHMMGVATPANHVAGDGPYVLFHNDFINLVATGLSPNRNDTRHHGFPSVDAHDFYESYLKETTTRKDIQNFIINQVVTHEKAPSQWETDQEFGLNTCDYKITVKHRYDPSIEMAKKVYPFNASKKLYQVNGEWVKASCGGSNILDQWDGKKDNECWMIDNPEEEKIVAVDNIVGKFYIHYKYSYSTQVFSLSGYTNEEFKTLEGCDGYGFGYYGSVKIIDIMLNYTPEQNRFYFVDNYHTDSLGCELTKLNKNWEDIDKIRKGTVRREYADGKEHAYVEYLVDFK